MKIAKTCCGMLAVTFCVAAALPSYGRSLLYYYDFDEAENSALVYTGVNRGTGTTEFTFRGFGANTIGCDSSGALGSAGAFKSSTQAALWLGDGASSLGCGTGCGFTISFWLKASTSHGGAWTDFFGFKLGGYDYRCEYNKAGTTSFLLYGGKASNDNKNLLLENDNAVTEATADTWKHFALVFSPGTNTLGDCNIYIDGERVNSINVLGAGNLQTIRLGALQIRNNVEYSHSSAIANTGIDELAVFDYPATKEQLKWLCQFRPVSPAADSGREMPVCWRFNNSGGRGLTCENSGTGVEAVYKWEADVTYKGNNDYANYSVGVFGSTHCFWLRIPTGNTKYWAAFRVDGDDADGIGATAGSGFAVSFWLKAGTSMAAWRSVFGLSLGARNIRLAWDNGNPSSLYAYGNGITSTKVLPSEKRTINEWQHVCLLWNGHDSRLDFYLDGERTVQIPLAQAPAASETVKMMMFGAFVPSSNSAYNYYNAGDNVYVDEAAFFNYSISTDEIDWLGAHIPSLPPLDATNLVRTVAANGAWAGGRASWTVRKWNDTNEAWVDTTRTTIYPALEDTEVEVAVTLADGVELTNDTIVTPKKLVLATGGTPVLQVATLKATADSRFAPQALEIVDGLQLTVPLYAVNVGGALTLGSGTKIVFDTANYGEVGGRGATALPITNALSVGSFVLPAGETNADILSHFDVTDNRFTLSLSADGKTVLVAADTIPVVATWTGAGDGTSLDSAANWDCRNAAGAVVADALPGAMTRVVVCSGTAAMNAPAGTVIPWQYLSFEAGNATLPAAVTDWRGLDAVAIPRGVTVNLGGNKLYVNETIEGTGTITDAAAGGELHIDVAEGQTLRNSTLAIAGTLKLVKAGDGTYISALAQSYTGGTLVSAGTIQPHDAPTQNNTAYSGEKVPAFGTGAIIVASNAVFDVRGNYAFYGLASLAGGTLANSGPYDMTQTGWGGSGVSSLTEDSSLSVPHSLVFQSKTGCDLGGHTLSITMGSAMHLYLKDTAFSNGTIEIGPTGFLHPVTATDASTVSFKVNSAMKVDGALDVRDYEALFQNDYNDGDEVVNVHGTFKPSAHDRFHGCKMLDGSTLDLSSRTNALPLVSTFTDGAKTLGFEAGATVHVKFGGYRATSREPIISWTEKPVGIDMVKFATVPGERTCGFAKKNDGLYITRGLLLIVR